MTEEQQKPRLDICSNCKFAHVEQANKNLPPDYTCRRNPPFLMSQAMPKPNLGGTVSLEWQRASAWPYVRLDSWCGEHKPCSIPSAIRLS